MNKQDLRAYLDSLMALPDAPKVTVVPEGTRTVDPAIRYCKCGCKGDWTEHTMRLGENGMR